MVFNTHYGSSGCTHGLALWRLRLRWLGRPYLHCRSVGYRPWRQDFWCIFADQHIDTIDASSNSKPVLFHFRLVVAMHVSSAIMVCTCSTCTKLYMWEDGASGTPSLCYQCWMVFIMHQRCVSAINLCACLCLNLVLIWQQPFFRFWRLLDWFVAASSNRFVPKKVLANSQESVLTQFQGGILAHIHTWCFNSQLVGKSEKHVV